MPRAIVPLELASTRIEASTVPMHGAAQTANAPPSRRAEPRAARALQQARRDGALRPRQQPEEREPEHDEHEAGDLGLRRLVDDAARSPRRRRRAATKTTVKPSDERQARDDDAPRRPALAEAVDLDRRDRRRGSRARAAARRA